MVVAVYADLKTFPLPDADLYFIKSFINNLAARHAQYSFFLIGPGLLEEFGERSFPVCMIPLTTSTGFFYKYRLNRELARKLKDANAAVMLSINIIAKVAIPQSVLFTGFIRERFSRYSLSHIKNLFVLSEAGRNKWSGEGINKDKIKMIYGGPSETDMPASEEFKNHVKNKFTEGKEYFLYRGPLGPQQNIIKLLKGFSFFKKRQRTSMKLVLVGELLWPKNEFEKLINTYKYREDIVTVNKITEEEKANLLAASFCYIQLHAHNNLLFVLNAMQSGVPVLCEGLTLIKDRLGESALYFEAADDVAIAEKMMFLYKDEGQRNRIIENGKTVAAQYNWQETIEQVWRNLQTSKTD